MTQALCNSCGQILPEKSNNDGRAFPIYFKDKFSPMPRKTVILQITGADSAHIHLCLNCVRVIVAEVAEFVEATK